MNLKESKTLRFEAKRKEAKGRKNQELLATEVEPLKKELANYKAGKESH